MIVTMTMLTKILRIIQTICMTNVISSAIAHRYAIFLCSWDVDNSLVGQLTSPAKVIHTVGVVGRVEWRDLGGHDYSGIFKGAQHGLARWVSVSSTTSASFPRLSLALEPDTSKLNTAPGMGLKFLRDGRDSANLVAMYSVDGQESWNFFKNDFSNHIPRFDYYYHVDGDRNFDDKTVQYWCRKLPALKGAKSWQMEF